MNTIPEHGGTAHSQTTPIITTERHDVTDKAPSPPKAPDAFNIQEHVLDHAGAFHEWFNDAYVESAGPHRGKLRIIAASDSREYLFEAAPDSEQYGGPRSRLFTPDQVWAVILQEHTEWQPIDPTPANYIANYYADLVAEHWDDLDGDMNTTDTILQRLAFGETVFG